jgi:hypothetical protein
VSSNSATAQKEGAMEQKEKQFTWPGPQDTPQAMIDKLNTAELLVRDVKNQAKIRLKVEDQ